MYTVGPPPPSEQEVQRVHFSPITFRKPVPECLPLLFSALSWVMILQNRTIKVTWGTRKTFVVSHTNSSVGPTDGTV